MKKEKIKIKLDIDKEITELIKQNAFGEKERPVAKLLLTWMNYGRKEAEKLPKVKQYIKNLEKNGFVDKKSGNLFITADKEDEMYIEFLLMINGAYGYVERVEEKEK